MPIYHLASVTFSRLRVLGGMNLIHGVSRKEVAIPCAQTVMGGDLDSLVLNASHGDAEAYGELVSRTSGLVTSVTLAIVRDIDLSRDVAQEVFLALWRDLKNLRNPASFLPWLRQTARNRAHAAVRSRIRARRLGETGAFDAVLTGAADPQPNAAEQLARDEEARALQEALDALPDETREIVILYYREGESVARVAALCELSETVVKKRLSRARERLRSEVRERLGETVRRSAPDERFTAMVIAALPAMSVPTAAGGALGAMKAFGAGVLKLILLPSLASGLGGTLGVTASVWPLLRSAFDEQERLELLRYRRVAIGLVLAWALAVWPVVKFSNANLAAILTWFAGFFATLAILQHGWLSRILRRRHDAERRANPEAAARAQRKGFWIAVVGLAVGVALGLGGVAAGFWFSK
jgi:RNA polymerase sigma factor (sigma-70 family)